MSSPSPGSGSKARCASKPASPAISSSRSKRPGSRSPADRMPSPDASRMRRGCGVAALPLRSEWGPHGSIPPSVCIEAEEGLSPHSLGCGLKEGEQGFSRPGTPNAIVALGCARGGNMPADCSQSPLVGRCAGKRVLVQGDYAEDDDIPNWDGPALSKLYTAMTPADQREPWDGMPDGYWDNVPVFADISDEARGFLEAACNIRYFDQTQKLYDGRGKVVDSWTSTHFVRVKPKARHFGECGVAEYVIDTCYSADDLSWMKKQYGMRPIDVQRVPRSGDWHGLLPSEIAEGHHRVIVNLDTLEYLDPARCRPGRVSSAWRRQTVICRSCSNQRKATRSSSTSP